MQHRLGDPRIANHWPYLRPAELETVGVDWQKAFTNEFNPTFCEHSAAFYQALFLYLANISSVIYVPNTVLCIEGTVQRNVPIKGFIVPGGNYPAGIYSPRSCPSSPRCPPACPCVACVLLFFSHVLECFPCPHPLLLLWCDPVVLADMPEGESGAPCGCAAGLGWRQQTGFVLNS